MLELQVPFVVLNLRRAAQSPVTTAGRATLGALRSTSFLATFVALYQATVGVHRKLVKGSDSKLLYYVAGGLSRTYTLSNEPYFTSLLALSS